MTFKGYFIEKEEFEKLRAISDRLHAGSDAMRDEGCKLLLVLDGMNKVELWPCGIEWDTWEEVK
jgi:hypothetical protein